MEMEWRWNTLNLKFEGTKFILSAMEIGHLNLKFEETWSNL